MIPNITLLDIYNMIEEVTGKKVRINIYSDVFKGIDYEDAKAIKESFEKHGIEFIKAKHIIDETYYMSFKFAGVQIDLVYEQKKTIDEEIEQLESRLNELKARKAEDGEG